MSDSGQETSTTDEQQPRRIWDRIAGARIDITPLRTSREFRILFISGIATYVPATFTMVALPFQLYDLTRSNLAVGLIGAFQLIPLVIFGLWGGALADRWDRRRTLLVTGTAHALLLAILVGNAVLAQPQVWVLYLVAVVSAAVAGVSRPSKEALTPIVVRHDQIPAAVALNSLVFQIAMLIGPGIAGVMAATLPIWTVYTVAMIGIASGTVILLGLRPHPVPRVEGEQVQNAFNSINAGLRYALSRKDLLGTYLIDMIGMLLAFPIVLFPALAEQVFAAPALLGLFYTAEAVGSMLFTLTSGWTARIHHHGRAVTLAAMGWGAAIGAAGLMGNIWAAIVCFGLAGAFDMMSGQFRGVIWHQTIPTHLRGRLAGIEMLSYSIGPLLGQLRAGVVADLTSVRASIVSGGALCVLGVAGTAAVLRGFWNYDARTDEHALAQRAAREADDER